MEQPKHDLRANMGVAAQATPRRFIALGIVALLHVVLIYALAAGLAGALIQKLPEELKAEVVKEQIPDKTPPPPPPDLAKPPPPFVPPPVINIQSEAPATNAITVQSKVASPPAPVQTSAPKPIHARNCDAGYPEISRRLGEEGKVLVQFTIEADGRTTNVSVAGTSGHDRLDQAALQCISDWRWKPAEAGGKPVAVQTKLYIQYKLH